MVLEEEEREKDRETLRNTQTDKNRQTENENRQTAIDKRIGRLSNRRTAIIIVDTVTGTMRDR